MEREKKLNVILQTSPADHTSSATRIVNEAKTLAQQKKKIMKDLAVFVGQHLIKERNGSKLVELHRDDVDMSFLQGVAAAAKVM